MPVFAACSQYLVLGCRVVSSLVVNVTRFEVPVIAVEVVRVCRTVSLGIPPLSVRMEKLGLVSPIRAAHRYTCTLLTW